VRNWRKLHNEELHNLYASRDEKCIQYTGSKSYGKRNFGRPRRRWEDYVRMDLTHTGSEGVEWIHLAEDRDQEWTVVRMVMNIPVP